MVVDRLADEWGVETDTARKTCMVSAEQTRLELPFLLPL